MNDVLFQIFSVLSDGVIATDAQSKILFMNAAAEKLTGWPFTKAKGRALDDVFKIIDQNARFQITESPVDEVLTTGKPTDITNQTILTSQTGQETVIKKCGLPIRDSNDQIIGAVLVLKESEQQAETDRKIKDHLTLKSSNFADSITHKFNNLLMAIWGNASLLKMKTTENKDVADNVCKIEDSCRQAKELSKLLNTYLKDFEKLENGIVYAEPDTYQEATITLPKDVVETKQTVGHILVMDDEEMLRELTTRCLTRLGYKVTTAKNGEEVIRLFKQAMDSRPYDAIIMDLTVPGGLGGKETIAEIRKIDPNVKAIIASGYLDDPVLNDYKKYGFSAVIRKPFHINELHETLNRIL